MIAAVVLLAHAVSIQAPGADQAQIAAAVDGCNQALREDRCVASSEAQETEWIATITWSDEERRLAHVLLTRRGGEAAAQVSREVEFGPADPLEHRFRAVGLIIAAYVIASGRSAADSSAELPTPSEPVDERPASPEESESEVRREPAPPWSSGWGVDAAVLVGSGLQATPSAWGGALRPWWQPSELPLLAVAQVRLRTTEDVVRVDWLSASLGMGFRVEMPSVPWTLELRCEAVVEHASLRAEEPASARRERAGSWRVGGRAGADAFVSLADRWALFVGGDVNLLRPHLAVDVAGEPVGREPRLSVQGLFGVRFRQD